MLRVAVAEDNPKDRETAFKFFEKVRGREGCADRKWRNIQTEVSFWTSTVPAMK